MKTEIFDFDLPPELIANAPLNPRDAARMLVVGDNNNVIQDKKIRDLLGFLRAGDVMVFNDSKVIPARLLGKRGEVKIEVLLHKKCYSDLTISSLRGAKSFDAIRTEKENWIASPSPFAKASADKSVSNDDLHKQNQWQCFVKPAKRLKIGDIIAFADDFCANVLHKYDDGQVLLAFDYGDEIFWQKLEQYGAMPLPPYIERVRHAEAMDNQTYQTIYARHAGSVAAPTAGLHFTEELLAAIEALGVKRVSVTLHVGGGTFLPVKVADTKDHIMHSEFASISQEAAEAINEARRAGGRVVAVGTTSVRTLESAADEHGELRAFSGETSIFITPSYRFKLVDIMLTNFHLPRSTLFMLVCAFAGTELMQTAYAHAIAQKYRFYSYGDACLLMRAKT